MTNPVQIKISCEIDKSISRFCIKHGITKKHFTEEALVKHLTEMNELYSGGDSSNL